MRNYLTRFVDLAGPLNSGELRRLSSVIGVNPDTTSRNVVECLESDLRLDRKSVSEAIAMELIAAMPLMKPRSYSASGWPDMTLCVSCKPGVADTYGLCSEYLCRRITPGSEVYISIRPGSDKLRAIEFGTEIVFICAGSGIAVFKAFLDFFSNRPIRPNISLLYGCRHPEEDWLYREEVIDALDSGSLKQAVFAFSRVSDSKEYVQHKLACIQPEAVLNKGGHLVISGSTAMCRDVLCELGNFRIDVDKLCEQGAIVVEAFG